MSKQKLKQDNNMNYGSIVARFCCSCDALTERADCMFCRACARRFVTATRDELWADTDGRRGMLEVCRLLKQDNTERVLSRAQRENRLYELYNADRERNTNTEHDLTTNHDTNERLPSV